jgi:hypothetical protein
MKIVKDHIVEARFTWGWEKSNNPDARGLYTEAGAKKRAKEEMSKATALPKLYRAKKVKAKR